MSSTLATTIAATQEKFRLNPADARVTFRTASELRQPFRSDVTIRSHAVVIDEPTQIGGGDSGPTPVEMLLAALAACQEITYKGYATALGIDIKRVAIRLEGDIDLGAFFGVNDQARAGFNTIRGEIEIDSDAPRADLERLKQTVDAHCPVLDMLTTPVAVDLKLSSL